MADQEKDVQDVKWEEQDEDYRAMMKAYARMAADHPERIDNIRSMLKFSAEMMISNRPEVVDQFREAVKELDAFLNACKNGEIEPRKLLERMEKEE